MHGRLRIDPNGVEWEALNKNLQLVACRLILHAAVSENEVISWAEIVVDADRDARVARRVAIHYMRDLSGLVRVDDEEDEEPVDDEGERITYKTEWPALSQAYWQNPIS